MTEQNQSTESPELADLESVLYTEAQIQAKVAELAGRLREDYQGRDLVLIGILKGGIPLLVDLSRKIGLPHQIDMIGAQSYRGTMGPVQEVRITKMLDLPIHGKDVVLVEDIYDTGNTLVKIKAMVETFEPKSLEICAFIYKNKERKQDLDIKYIGYKIEDVFVVGYGLDYDEYYRNLPCIGVLDPKIYSG